MKELTTKNFDETVANGYSLVDFWAPWCGPCVALSPILEAVSKEFAGKVMFGKVNMDDYAELGAKYHVRSIPTLLIFKDGKLLAQKVGGQSKVDLVSWINENCQI